MVNKLEVTVNRDTTRIKVNSKLYLFSSISESQANILKVVRIIVTIVNSGLKASSKVSNKAKPTLTIHKKGNEV